MSANFKYYIPYIGMAGSVGGVVDESKTDISRGQKIILAIR